MSALTCGGSVAGPKAALRRSSSSASSRSAFAVGQKVDSVRVRAAAPQATNLEISANLKELRTRIESVSSTKKITDAMKLVAAAKVRRAQAAVIGSRPFSENLVKVLFAVNSRLAGEDVDVPLAEVRPVKNVLLVVCTGDRGLCGGYNNYAIRMAEKRYNELTAMGIGVKLMTIGKKGSVYFKSASRDVQHNIVKSFEMGQAPTTKDAQAVADEIFADFVSSESDKVEIVFTKFVSLITTQPVIQTVLPLTPAGEVCDVNGTCIDATDDEIFTLTSKDGDFAVDREAATIETAPFEGVISFEQDPNQILDALLPLYMNAMVLRALQESIASELAARMNAMNTASDNAKELKKNLSLTYNRKRQAKITNEIIELAAGASAV